MKSVIAVRPGHLEVRDTPVPKPGPYQALARRGVIKALIEYS